LLYLVLPAHAFHTRTILFRCLPIFISFTALFKFAYFQSPHLSVFPVVKQHALYQKRAGKDAAQYIGTIYLLVNWRFFTHLQYWEIRRRSRMR